MLAVILEKTAQIKVALAQLIKIDIITRNVQAKMFPYQSYIL